MHISLKRLHKDAAMPTLATKGSACYDLYTCENVSIKPGETTLIPTV